VCRPLKFGGLGIHNLEILGWALNVRWLWLRKTQVERPWTEFDIKVHPNAEALFRASVHSSVWDGATTLFWMDRWIQGQSIAFFAPYLFSRIPSRVRTGRTVQEALADNSWIQDISGGLTAVVIREFLLVWDLIQDVHQGVPFRCIPEKYKQIARSIESLLDLSTMTIEEAISRFKVVDDDEPHALSGPITIDGKLHLTREQWEASKVTRRRGSPRHVAANATSRARRAEAPRLGREDMLRVVPKEAPKVASSTTRSRQEATAVTTVASLATGPGVDSHDLARPTSHRQRRRRRLCF
jgi:hypothetical protein